MDYAIGFYVSLKKSSMKKKDKKTHYEQRFCPKTGVKLDDVLVDEETRNIFIYKDKEYDVTNFYGQNKLFEDVSKDLGMIDYFGVNSGEYHFLSIKVEEKDGGIDLKWLTLSLPLIDELYKKLVSFGFDVNSAQIIHE